MIATQSSTHLILSNAIKMRIASGELSEENVRHHTSQLFAMLNQKPLDQNGEISLLANQIARGVMKAQEPLSQTHPALFYYQNILNYYQTHKNNIDVKAFNGDGDALIGQALRHGFVPFAHALLEDGASATIVDHFGNNALIVALTDCPNHKALHKLTLDFGCDPHKINYFRRYNAISSSLVGERLDQVIWMLDHGLNAQAINIECTPSDQHYPTWVDLAHKRYSVRQVIELLIEHIDDRLVDMQHTDSGEQFGRTVRKQTLCHTILDRLDQTHKDWEAFKANPDVGAITAPQLLAFSTIGKLHEALNHRLWQGHEDDLTPHLGHLPPYILEDVLARHGWITRHLRASTTSPAPGQWTTRVDEPPTSPQKSR